MTVDFMRIYQIRLALVANIVVYINGRTNKIRLVLSVNIRRMFNDNHLTYTCVDASVNAATLLAKIQNLSTVTDTIQNRMEFCMEIEH